MTKSEEDEDMANFVLRREPIDDLSDVVAHYDQKDLLEQFGDGTLAEWLEEKGYDDEVKRLADVDKTLPPDELAAAVMAALGLEVPELVVPAYSENMDFAAAIPIWKKAAKAGDGVAACNLAKCHELGKGVQKNENMAAMWYKKAAKHDCPEALFKVGCFYETGSFVNGKDAEKAKELLKKAADAGVEEAWLHLGDVCAGCEDSNAVSYYEKAAELGFDEADLRLGDVYASRGAAEERRKAVPYYEKAAKRGNADAQFKLAELYEHGEIVERDLRKASDIDWKLAKAGNGAAEDKIGISPFRKSVGLSDVNLQLAKMAAEQGNLEVQKNLGYFYRHGPEDSRNAREAVKWYSKAAEQGNAEAQCEMGNSYRCGLGVAKDEREAVKWYRKAAEQGYADAQRLLGLAYSDGEGVEQDDVEAVKWFRKAADQGNAEAQCEMGDSYRNGWGVPENDEMAVEWYSKAAEHKNSRAFNMLGLCYLEGRGVDENSKKAEELFRLAIYHGHTVAKYYLGLLLRERAEKTGDINMARASLQWLKRALEDGVDGAQEAIDEAWDPDA